MWNELRFYAAVASGSQHLIGIDTLLATKPRNHEGLFTTDVGVCAVSLLNV
jgi:hypothetical protein